MLAEAEARFPNCGPPVDLTCVTPRQIAREAVTALAERSDIVLVVGSENSSNTQALVRVERARGVPAYRVEGPDGVDATWFATAGWSG